jgi:hypothetical protein
MNWDKNWEKWMARPKNHKNNRVGARRGEQAASALPNPHAHLIRIPEREAMKRAIAVLGEVRVPYCGFTDSRLLVVTEHLEALRREAIPFEELS